MILYFDNLITDIPLVQGIYTELDKIRDSCDAYKMPSKLKITLYTLMSYAEIDWSEVIIKYELDDVKKRDSFEGFVKKIFPKAHFIYGRSDNQKKFQETMKLINSFKDEWVFYAGNNDHPFIASDKSVLLSCLKKAEEIKDKTKTISIIYSHFSESLSMIKKGTPNHIAHYPDARVLEETKDYFVVNFPRGHYTSVQIVHKDLLNYWLFSEDFKDTVIKRIEDAEKFVKTENQIVIIPKKPVCEHFDGYSHTGTHGHNIPSELVPPLFIPDGFFNKNIKIAFGFNDYRDKWVNINPLKNEYCFQDENGTDLMIGLEDIPLFWKKRIKKIEINPNLDKDEIKKARDEKFNKIKNPFLVKNKLYQAFYRTKVNVKRIVLHNTPKSIYSMFQKSGFLRKIHDSLMDY